MMKKNQLLAGAVLLSLAGWSGAAAADQVYTLNPVVVTAQRMETTEIETPATETVVTAKKIEEAGYKNAFDIIESQVGLTSTGYGDGGQDFGFSSGRTVIRGYDRGTLVMVDGIPMPLTQDRLADISHKPVAVYAVTDRNLAKLCFDRLTDCGAIKNEEDMSE